jgi:hypothetical protein
MVTGESAAVGRPRLRAQARPVGRMQRVFVDVFQLPRRQQAKVIELVETLVDQHRRQAS